MLPRNGRVIEHHGHRRLLEVDDARLIATAGGRYIVQSQTGPLAAWTFLEATSDLTRAHAILRAGTVGGIADDRRMARRDLGRY